MFIFFGILLNLFALMHFYLFSTVGTREHFSMAQDASNAESHHRKPGLLKDQIRLVKRKDSERHPFTKLRPSLNSHVRGNGCPGVSHSSSLQQPARFPCWSSFWIHSPLSLISIKSESVSVTTSSPRLEGHQQP